MRTYCNRWSCLYAAVAEKEKSASILDNWNDPAGGFLVRFSLTTRATYEQAVLILLPRFAVQTLHLEADESALVVVVVFAVVAFGTRFTFGPAVRFRFEALTVAVTVTVDGLRG